MPQGLAFSYNTLWVDSCPRGGGGECSFSSFTNTKRKKEVDPRAGDIYQPFFKDFKG